MHDLGPADPPRVGAYRLLKVLGEGGMGRVYLARSERGRTVAVKLIRSELAAEPEFRRRFAQEVAAARQVGDAYTAPVLGADTAAPQPWVATGYVAGPSLHEVVAKQYGPLPPYSVLALAKGLTRALGAIQGAGLVHRDLKPSNILLTVDGPRVIDFGIARSWVEATATGDALTRSGSVIGSPGFMSPEQVRGERPGPASDVFSLGSVLLFARSGRLPFGADAGGLHAMMYRIAHEEEDLSGLTDPLLGLVRQCLVKDPAGRPSVAELERLTSDFAEPSGPWLPGRLLADLGRQAARLLDSESPLTRAVPPGTGTVPAYPPEQMPGFGAPVMPATVSYARQGASTPYAAPGASSARSVHGLAVALTAMIALGMTALIAETVARGDVLSVTASLDGRVSIRALEREVSGDARAAQVLNDVYVGITAATAALWCAWFHRLRCNAEVWAPGRVRYPSAIAIWCWFIPIGWFYVPKQITNDIWAVTAVPQPRKRWLLNMWWAFWCWWVVVVLNFAKNMLSPPSSPIFMSSGTDADAKMPVSEMIVYQVVDLLALLLPAIAASVFAALVVQRLTAWSTERMREAALQPGMPPSP